MGAVGEPLPAGFARASAAGSVFVYDETLGDELSNLGFLGDGGFAALLAGEPGASGRGSTLHRALPAAGVTLVVRPVLHGGLFGGLFRAALHSPARAFDELRTTEALRAAGAAVPRPALAAARRTGLVWNALVATVREEAAPDIVEFFASDPSQARIVRAAEAVARAIRKFHDAGGTHPDLHVKNVLLRETDSSCEAIVVDLDGARIGAPPDAARRMHELARLYRSSLKRGLTSRVDLEANRALLRSYVAGDEALGAALARHWPRERRRVAVHAIGYRKRESL